jgi:hypothetical protein
MFEKEKGIEVWREEELGASFSWTCCWWVVDKEVSEQA